MRSSMSQSSFSAAPVIRVRAIQQRRRRVVLSADARGEPRRRRGEDSRTAWRTCREHRMKLLRGPLQVFLGDDERRKEPQDALADVFGEHASLPECLAVWTCRHRELDSDHQAPASYLLE